MLFEKEVKKVVALFFRSQRCCWYKSHLSHTQQLEEGQPVHTRILLSVSQVAHCRPTTSGNTRTLLADWSYTKGTLINTSNMSYFKCIFVHIKFNECWQFSHYDGIWPVYHSVFNFNKCLLFSAVGQSRLELRFWSCSKFHLTWEHLMLVLVGERLRPQEDKKIFNDL